MREDCGPGPWASHRVKLADALEMRHSVVVLTDISENDRAAVVANPLWGSVVRRWEGGREFACAFGDFYSVAVLAFPSPRNVSDEAACAGVNGRGWHRSGEGGLGWHFTKEDTVIRG